MAIPSVVCAQVAGATVSALAVVLAVLDPPAAAAQYDSTLYSVLRWQNIGPDRGGRSTAVAGSAARPFEYYYGATGGGLWKTTDGGQTWKPVTDGQLKSSSVGAVQVCHADPDVVYLGMGETQLRGNIMQGDGVYKSTDGGRTWRHLGLAASQAIARIRIHPTDCNTVWVAALGVHSAASAERGIYKSTNGGETWRRVLFRDERSGAVDLSVDPGNPAVMYAALWEAWRKSWGMSSGGPGSGLFKSTDFGETWTEISQSPGLPRHGVLGRIGVAVSPAAPSRVWAIVEHDSGGVFRSDDAGATWTRVNDERRLRQRAFYFTRIYADPKNPDVVYAVNIGFHRSEDGGKTYRLLSSPHVDNHDLWIAPDNPQRMINANDGGANVSVNGGETWTKQHYPTAQFYRVITTHHKPYFVCGAQQDGSTVCVSSRGRSPEGGWPDRIFFPVGGGESGYIANSAANPDVYYAGSMGGYLTRLDYAKDSRRAVNVWPVSPVGRSSSEAEERFQWTFPIVFSHHDPNLLYVSSQHVWKTTNGGESWQRISPDLTRHDPTTMGPAGGPITKDQSGVETYATVFALAPSYHERDVIWAGSDDGLVHLTRDGGRTWQNVTPPDAPPFTRINTIEASPSTPGKAYLAGIRYLVDNDRRPYVWKTENYGATWTKIVSGIAESDFVRSVREDPTRPGLLFAGSESTVYVSWDDGARWQPLTLNLPNTQVSDVAVTENDLVISTHGRSFWVLYNIGPIRQLTPEIARAGVHLFRPSDPVRGIDNSVDVVYHLARSQDSVVLEVLDEKAAVIRRFVGRRDEPGRGGGGGGSPRVGVTAGSHRVTWNTRLAGYTEFEGRIFWGGFNQGPKVVPGRYQVRLTAGGVVQTRQFEVRLHPRLAGSVTLGDLQERFDLALEIRDRVSDANEAVIWIRAIRGAIDTQRARTSNQRIVRQADAVKARLSAVEEEIYQGRSRSPQDLFNYPMKLNNQLAGLLFFVEESEAKPVEQAYAAFERLDSLLTVQLTTLERTVSVDLAQLNRRLRGAGLEPVAVEKPKREGSS